MRARDVIVVARRRAALSQQELADRLGKPQPTIARWESGATEPAFATVLQAATACGLDLSVGLAAADASWVPLIYEQLQRSPEQRVLHVSQDGRGPNRLMALQTLARVDARLVVVGEAAGALHGWPLLLDPAGTVDVMVHPDDRAAARAEIDTAGLGVEIRLLAGAPGTTGYRDLARSAQSIEVDGEPVAVASLVDLLRIAMADTQPHSGQWALALDATLQETARQHERQVAVPQRTPEQARAEVDAWLSSR